MGFSPAWQAKYSKATAPSTVPQDQPNMSILAMNSGHPHSGFGREMPWETNRPSEFSSRHHGEPERVNLPSIRLAFPEIHLRPGTQDGHSRTPSSVTSPPTAVPSGAMTPPDYIHSPSNKRRRLSVEDEQEMERASRVPRLYETSAALSQQRQLSPPPSRRSVETWAPASRASPYPPQTAMPPMQAAQSLEVGERLEHRHPLPSLPPMQTFDPREPIHSHSQRPRGHSSDEFQQSRNVAMNTMANPAPPYRADGGYPYGFHHPSRVQSLSAGAIQPFDRATPFSTGGYGQAYHQDYMRIGELGPMGMNGDSKQRKRRGNLPKETTDKLRAWFVAHLQHPYPTEDEKQDLMRQTGLQMNQISNWFINARRRQLPTMMNNARAESDAMAGNRPGGAAGVATKVLPTTERLDHYGAPDVNEPGKARSSVPLSDGEGSYHDEEMDALNHRGRGAHIKRGSV